MRIALCDDELGVFREVQKFLEEFSKVNKISVQLDWFCSGVSLVKKMDEYALILLDIEMPEMDGIAFGREAHRREYQGKIVMLTGKPERFTEAFEIQAFRFVKKPIEKEKLFRALTDYLNTRIGEEQITVHWNRRKNFVREKDIYYIQWENCVSKVFMKSEVFQSGRSLDEWERVLDGRLFVRCDRQTVVNVAHILEVNSKIRLTNEENLSYSRRGRKKMQAVMDSYDLYYR